MTSAVPLGSVATLRKGAGLSKAELTVDGKRSCVHYGELFTKYGAVIEAPASRTDSELKVRSVLGDVLMPTSDVTPRGLAKASAIMESGVGLGGDILVIRPDRTQVDSRFLANLIRLDADQVLALVRGSTVYHLYASDMRTFELSLPPIAEQSRAADALQDVDFLIATLERVIARKQAIKQGMIQQLLTGKTRLPGFTEPWVEATIGTLGRVTGGGTPPTRVGTYWGGVIPWFTPAEIKAEGSGLVSHSERTINHEGLSRSAASLLPAGSVLVTSRASIGNCAVAEVPVATNQGFASLIPNDRRSTWFFYYWVQQNRSEFESRSAGSTFLEISASKASSIPLGRPGLDEQRAIGEALRDADVELDGLKRRLAKARAIKIGMMQQLLTGRTRLTLAEDAA